jgi:hypothetical protein
MRANLPMTNLPMTNLPMTNLPMTNLPMTNPPMRTNLPGTILLLTLLAVLLAVASCGGGGQGTAGSALAGANLRVLLTDSPVDEADAVYVVIDGVEVMADTDTGGLALGLPPTWNRSAVARARENVPLPVTIAPESGVRFQLALAASPGSMPSLMSSVDVTEPAIVPSDVVIE